MAAFEVETPGLSNFLPGCQFLWNRRTSVVYNPSIRCGTVLVGFLFDTTSITSQKDPTYLLAMKFIVTLAGLVGLAVASPFTEHDTSGGLMGELLCTTTMWNRY